MLKKGLYFITILIVSLFLISSVSALEDSTNETCGINDAIQVENNGDVISICENESDVVNTESMGNSTLTDEGYEDDYDDIWVEVEPITTYYNSGEKLVFELGDTTLVQIDDGEKIVYSEWFSASDRGSCDLKGLAPGKYNVKFYDNRLGQNLIEVTTITILESSTKLSVKSFTALPGGKYTIKAYLKDKNGGKSYNTGIVKFKIDGKTYSANLKNGVASLKITAPKNEKTFSCSATFNGNKYVKGSSAKFNIKVSKSNTVVLKKNRSIQVGKYTIKLTQSQYNTLVNAFKNSKSKSISFNSKYNYPVKSSYSKPVKIYKTTTAVKTLYSVSYMPMINKMKSNGWTKVSEYTYTKANSQYSQGIGLSAYTYAVCKWVKTSYKTSYKTTYYPIKVSITTGQSSVLPKIKLYSHGKTLTNKYLVIE